MDENDHIQPTLSPEQSKSRLKRITEFATKTTHVKLFGEHCSHCPRYISLRKQEMFDHLVDLYANVFSFKLYRDESCLEFLSPPTGVPLRIYAARCYISMWFIDLYVSNRNAVKNLAPVAYIEHFRGKLLHVPCEYDHYLALLNASIRPTYLKHSLDNWLYIPVIADSPDVSSPNPFGINNFTPLKDCYMFGRIMKGMRLGHLMPLSNDAMGRPWWLFDWHYKSDVHVCSWFPAEGNYDVEDVTLAYVLGTACTANLGPRDVDEWQYFADGLVPEKANLMKYDRVAGRKFYGSHEVTTVEIDADFSLARAVAAGRGSGQSGEEREQDYAVTPRYRLVNWLYHQRVVWHVDEQTRDRMHRPFYDYDIPESLW